MRAEGRERKRTIEYVRREILSGSTARYTCVCLGPNWRLVRRGDSVEYILRSLPTPWERRSRSDKWFGPENATAVLSCFSFAPWFLRFRFLRRAHDTLVTNVSRRYLRIKNSRRCYNSISWRIATTRKGHVTGNLSLWNLTTEVIKQWRLWKIPLTHTCCFNDYFTLVLKQSYRLQQIFIRKSNSFSPDLENLIESPWYVLEWNLN